MKKLTIRQRLLTEPCRCWPDSIVLCAPCVAKAAALKKLVLEQAIDMLHETCNQERKPRKQHLTK